MNSTSNNPMPESAGPASAEPDAAERWALVQRIAASEHFSRSARLRDFLLYVGKHSLKSGSPEVHEQEIGAKVFGRSPNYDRSQDNIVRVNASELRKRIDAYFAAAGAEEPLILEIPRGSYKPVFRYRIAEAAESEQLLQGATPEDRETFSGRIRRLSRFLWPALGLSLAICCVVQNRQNHTLRALLEPWADKPAVAEFWKGFLDTHLQTDIVLPDDSASVVEDITGAPTNLGEYLNRDMIRRLPSLPLSEDRRQDALQVFSHNLVTFGAIRAEQQIQSQIPQSFPRQLVWSRFYTADELKRNNVILIGGRKSVPWDHLFDEQLNFITDFDHSQGRMVVRNRSPKPGEQPTYTAAWGPDNFVAYSVIAYLPNPSRTGHVIILAGADSDATAAAAEFLTSEDQMERLKATLHVQHFPYFEVLLKASRLNGTSFRSDPIAYRTYPDLH
jgi:hypothetical protein